VIYAKLRQLLFYLTTSKAEGHEKLVNVRVFEIRSLIYRIKVAVEEDRDVWDDIALITLLKGMPEEYDAKKKSLLNQKAVIMEDA